MSNKRALAATIHAWQGKHLLILGDVVADEHVVGRPRGIAREAPVLVLSHMESRLLPGGATNVAANAAALGARVHVCGAIGADETGRRLKEALEAAGMECGGIVVALDRETTTKTRVWAGGEQQLIQQLLLRLDRVNRQPVPESVTAQMAAYVTRVMDGVAALMISDYENGVIHPGIIAASLPLARQRGKIVAVDSHGDLYRFRGATLFTPNQPEAEATLGRELANVEDLEQGGRQLLAGLEAGALLITRGQEGMSLFVEGEAVRHLPASPASAVDPTGAGDTVAAAFTLAVAAGASFAAAAQLANLAASIVVGRVGTATATSDELLAAVEALPD